MQAKKAWLSDIYGQLCRHVGTSDKPLFTAKAEVSLDYLSLKYILLPHMAASDNHGRLF